MTIQINGVAMPLEMSRRPHYRFIVEEWGRNGQNQPILAPYATVNWRITHMMQSDWTWWATTLLAGQRSAIFTGVTVLWNDDGVEQTFSYCQVLKPQWKDLQLGIYHDVLVRIEQLQ